MTSLPICPACRSVYTYELDAMFVCPECAHEWPQHVSAETASEAADAAALVVRDANGTVLTDGDTVTLIKDLKLRGSSTVVKVGTKVRNIRLVEGDHDIDCRIEGIGPMKLKSEFVRRA